jgi:NitT/TauT family transport system substrate-binding protein
MSLIFTAKEKGFFQGQGLDVEIKEFTAGKFALQAFLGGSVDFAVAGEVPVCLAYLQGNEVQVITQVVQQTVNEVRVVAIKDGGIVNPTEYFKAKRRKLSTSLGGGPEFFTHKFLQQSRISKDEVEIISQRPEDMPAALETRSVDAIAIFDPFAFIAEQRLGDGAITFSAPVNYSELYVWVARPEQVQKNPELMEAVIRSLTQAAAYMRDHPDDAKKIMGQYTKLDRNVVDGIWGNFSFRPFLGRKLIDYWEQEGAWAKESGKVAPDMALPDFRRVVDDRFLRKVEPDAVEF